MGTRRTGNGGNWPPEGDRSPDEQPERQELPELPPEWGDITIPDDPSALAEEAEEVRRELARERMLSWRQRLSGPRPADSQPAIGVPLLIMAVAMLITLISLFAMAWSGPAPPVPHPRPMPPVTLTDASGGTVTTTDLGPAAILLVDDCDCARLITDTVAAAPPGVTVVAVDATAPPRQPGTGDALRLADPDGALREALGLSPPTGAAATVILVDQHGDVVYTGRAAAVNSFRSPMVGLAP